MPQASQVPPGEWWKWVLGIGVGAVALAGAVTVVREARKPSPWQTLEKPKRRTDFEGVEYYVLEDDKTGDWEVTVTDYLEVDGEDMRTGSLRESWGPYEAKRDAVKAARAMAKKDKARGTFKRVRVIATPADHRAAEARRLRLEEE